MPTLVAQPLQPERGGERRDRLVVRAVPGVVHVDAGPTGHPVGPPVASPGDQAAQSVGQQHDHQEPADRQRGAPGQAQGEHAGDADEDDRAEDRATGQHEAAHDRDRHHVDARRGRERVDRQLRLAVPDHGSAQPGDRARDREDLHLAHPRADGEGPRRVLVVPDRLQGSAEAAVPHVAHQPRGHDQHQQGEEVVVHAHRQCVAEDRGLGRLDAEAQEAVEAQQPARGGQRQGQRGDGERQTLQPHGRDPDERRGRRRGRDAGREAEDEAAGVLHRVHRDGGADAGVGELAQRELAGDPGEQPDGEPDQREADHVGHRRGRGVGDDVGEAHRSPDQGGAHDPREPADRPEPAVLRRQRGHHDPLPADPLAGGAAQGGLAQQGDDDHQTQRQRHGVARVRVGEQQLLEHTDPQRGHHRDRDRGHPGDHGAGQALEQDVRAERVDRLARGGRRDQHRGEGRDGPGDRPGQRGHPTRGDAFQQGGVLVVGGRADGDPDPVLTQEPGQRHEQDRAEDDHRDVRRADRGGAELELRQTRGPREGEAADPVGVDDRARRSG